MEAQHTPIARVGEPRIGESTVLFLRKQEDGSRWPTGTNLFAETPLVIAAPDLLAACQALLDALPSATTHPAIAQARAAINKATGQ